MMILSIKLKIDKKLLKNFSICYIINSRIKRPFLQKTFLRYVGYFYKPERLLFESLFIVLFFTFIFYCIISQSKDYILVNNWLKILTSLETSFLFFIGNFDSTSLRLCVRITGYIETILGYITLNSFLISFGRKYLK